MVYGLDEVDRRILYGLMVDARGTSAPELADDLDVSPATIRNRIGKLEAAEVITGYRAGVDFERAEGRIANLYLCNAPVADRETYAARVQAVPGVVHVRELMTGRRNLHVLAVGKDTRDLRRVARAISALGIEIEDEDLVQTETHVPYAALRSRRRERPRAPRRVRTPRWRRRDRRSDRRGTRPDSRSDPLVGPRSGVARQRRARDRRSTR